MNPEELRRTLVLANAFKEGDRRVGGGDDERDRADARAALLGLRVGDIQRTPIVEDGVTEALTRSLDRALADALAPSTIGDVRTRLLAEDGAAWAARHRDGLSSEVIAAVVKVMDDDALGRVACAIANPLSGEPGAIGSAGHFGSRIQPNSPGDADDEILFSTLEGLAYGCGDVILGLNPARDDLDTIVRLESLLAGIVERLALPTRYCVLSDLVKQDRARARTRVDVGFQSLAGTSAALNGMVGRDVDGLRDLCGGFEGLYFETGQGSEVTNGTAEGVDMVTLESRTYGVARCLARASGVWTIVNDVAGFIGPEVFRTPAQLERSCLEDSVMAKLHGLTMGLDVCATFHMGISPDALRALTERIVIRAAPAYLMAVAGNADPMLGYLTTSFREHAPLRRLAKRRMAPAMAHRLTALGVDVENGRDAAGVAARLFAAYASAGGDRRSAPTLAAEGARTLHTLRERGFDLGGDESDGATAGARVDRIYQQARRALYARIDRDALAAASPTHVRVSTEAADRDDYLAHPERGERLDADSARRLASLAEADRAPVRIVLSDGLNADALNRHVGALLPPLTRQLAAAGHRTASADIVIENGRVRAGYHVGLLTGAVIVIHLIGERPGTGLDTLSAYLTYGLDEAGTPRWRPDLDHAHTTAICGIHPLGMAPRDAVTRIAHVTRTIVERRCSGVALDV